MARPVGTTRTQRMRKLACECGYIAYTSRRWIERGLPLCPCGAQLLPEDPDDAALVLTADQLAEHPAVVAYKRAVASVMHGQSGPARALRNAGGRGFRSPDEIAAQRLERERRDAARARQLGALRRGPVDPSRQPAPVAADPIPF
jgi:hypothetical protein